MLVSLQVRSYENKRFYRLNKILWAKLKIASNVVKKYKICPWDYSKARANIKGVIRLDYAPYWMITGLIFEKLLIKTSGRTTKQSPLYSRDCP